MTSFGVTSANQKQHVEITSASTVVSAVLDRIKIGYVRQYLNVCVITALTTT